MSGIYIPGMEMPSDKAIAVVIHPDGTAYSAEMFAGVCTQYIKDCSAIPVPDHGRLGDLDELIADLQPTDEDIRSTGADLMLAVFVEVLKSCPTIIPASKKSAEERAAGGVGPYEEAEGESKC